MDGREAAAALRAQLRQRVEGLRARGVVPTLAIVQADRDERTRAYVHAKQQAAKEIGVEVQVREFDPTLSVETLGQTLRETIERLNDERSVHGILLQLPLPEGVDADELLNAIDPRKDVDGLTATNQAALETGRELLVPATPLGILRLLETYGVSVAGATVAVIGQGLVVGKPLAFMLRSRGATVRTADAETPDLRAVTRGADIVVSATGQPGLITDDLLDANVVLIDAGLAEVGTSLMGDTTSEAQAKARLGTPIRGGVGPMTVASLLGNVVLAAEYQSLMSTDMEGRGAGH
ncbi:bifunctional 5,10-methylenetetrahydrofolate dehydrogenase/5,10-methenyltetrahydrofolate cyclohydrolase [Candidatus Berkelbacteria bacterium]|nr:bifunctional 5,10-methylenetetrahydrofolate dehydrogenase/5,10-methenyltetrahydrofolate cyclohydrolase [Candidatus Berkelbacteria bacterium]